MKKRILSILLLCCMVLIMLPTTVLAADGPMDTIPKYDVSIDVYNRTSDISIKDSRSYYIYSSVPDKLRDTWAWDKKIFIQGDKAAPHVFIDGVNIKMSPSSKGPAIELNKKASAYLYFIGKDSTLQGADGRAAIQKNRSEGQLYVLARTGTTVTCKGGYRAAGIGGSWAIRNIGDSMFNMDMYGHGVNMHFGSQSNPDYWGGTINATGGEYGAGIGAQLGTLWILWKHHPWRRRRAAVLLLRHGKRQRRQACGRNRRRLSGTRQPYLYLWRQYRRARRGRRRGHRRRRLDDETGHGRNQRGE